MYYFKLKSREIRENSGKLALWVRLVVIVFMALMILGPILLD